jgi:hypothetical protein
MFNLPRTPSIETLPQKVAPCALVLKGCGACALRVVDFSIFSSKYLFLERKYPTGFCHLSPRLRVYSSEFAVLSTSAISVFFRRISIYLSIFKKKERRKEELEEKPAIHGLRRLLKKASTGFMLHPRLFRGYSWSWLFIHINRLDVDQVGIPASTDCFASGVAG